MEGVKWVPTGNGDVIQGSGEEDEAVAKKYTQMNAAVAFQDYRRPLEIVSVFKKPWEGVHSIIRLLASSGRKS